MAAVINARKRTVTPRHLILGIASVAVLGMVLYLFIQVRTTTASSAVPQRTPPAPTASATDTETQAKPDEPPSKVASRAANLPVRAERPAAPVQPAETASGSSDTPAPTLDNVAITPGQPNPKLDAVMAEANKAYDRGEFDEAKSTALKVLAKDPANVRMLRIVVSANCIDGDAAEAQKHYLSLPGPDREQMKVRCARYGVTFNDK
ncbi:MAG: hypothetical protein JNL83_15555 [Myxococcales bacterium]|nr:hypothetical protein [Myxococcales bacterium]